MNWRTLPLAALSFIAFAWHAAAPAAPDVPSSSRPATRSGAPAAGTEYRQLNWDELVPPGWDPMKAIDMREIASLPDGDPRARAALDKLRALWDKAPVRKELNNARVRLPGFVVPLKFEGKLMREFLLVPYFGACVHSPPPPSNQVVHVVLDRPAKVEMMDLVWVSGRMRVASSSTEMGEAGYRIEGVDVSPYGR